MAYAKNNQLSQELIEKQTDKAQKLVDNGCVSYNGFEDGFHVFTVEGTTNYTVKIKTDTKYKCECPDFGYRGHIRPCKHVVACFLWMTQHTDLFPDFFGV